MLYIFDCVSFEISLKFDRKHVIHMCNNAKELFFHTARNIPVGRETALTMHSSPVSFIQGLLFQTSN